MFFQKPYLVLEHIQIFQEPLFSHRTDINFPGDSIFSSNKYSFSRKPYLVLEHIIFQESPIPRIDWYFPGRYPLSNRYFDNRSRWLLSKQPPRQFLKISVLFFQEQPFYNIPGGSICSSNRHEFSRRVNLFFEQT